MTVPIQVSWDLYAGQIMVWCDCLRAGARRAVLLPRLDTIFAPVEADPARARPYEQLDWRLVSPTEEDWERYRELVARHAPRYGAAFTCQRVENLGRWVGGRQVAVPQYHIWLYQDQEVKATIEHLYDALDAKERARLWRWLLAWTTPTTRAGASNV
jgi:hypothetical protein